MGNPRKDHKMHSTRKSGIVCMMLGLGLATLIVLACGPPPTHPERPESGTPSQAPVPPPPPRGIPGTSKSPAAQISKSKLTVPVTPADDYVKTHFAFSPVTVETSVSNGNKYFDVYSRVVWLTNENKDDQEWDYTTYLAISYERGGKPYRTVQMSGDFDAKIDLSDLAKEIGPPPEGISVGLIMVEKRKK